MTNEKIKETIKTSIKKIIKEKGLTVEKVATRMNIKGPALSQAINGNPSIVMLQRIANALEVDIRELFEGPNEELYGLVQYKGHSYKTDSVESLKRLLSSIETEKATA